ncbi:hypothetical protein D5S17_29805 [Pseudonocardiaceae bacterium YIM PH 21723]|nr:hypothetical protein D5S17_29805 [Pseudonocardiaceae bacterium YIM PH 21723]
MAEQLPRGLRGERLCAHEAPGYCTWWCNNKRWVFYLGPVLVALASLYLYKWFLGSGSDRTEIVNACYGFGIVLACTVPIVLYQNWQEMRDN